jgi:hypothetical protein
VETNFRIGSSYTAALWAMPKGGDAAVVFRVLLATQETRIEVPTKRLEELSDWLLEILANKGGKND